MSDEITKKLDLCGKQPPTPNLMLKETLDTVPVGATVEVTGDKSSARSLQRFVRTRGHEIIASREEDNVFIIVVKKCYKPGITPLNCIIIPKK